VTNLKHINDMEQKHDMETILDQPIHVQAKYADIICVMNSQNVEFARDQLVGFDQSPQFNMWNLTSIGNCAFMALRTVPEYRDGYKKMLEKYIEWRRNPTQDHDPDIPDFCVVM
jgi:hypothetical protein